MNKQELDKADSILWARKALDDPNSIILDLETTSLGGYPENRIVQISIINMKGQCLFSTMLDPEIPIPLATSKIHGITNADVKLLPKFGDICAILNLILTGKNVISYNNSFDITLLVSTYKGMGFHVPYFTEECCMDWYNQYVGEWNEKKGGYKWKKLPHLAYGKAHDALNDCLSTLEVIKIMAGVETDLTSEDFSLDF